MSDAIPRRDATLKARGYDGLYHPEQPCGCYVDDLYPCGERPRECRPGVYRVGPNGPGIYPAHQAKGDGNE